MLVGQILWKLPSAVATFAIAILIGPEEFGGFGLINGTVQMLVVYAGLRLGATVTKHVSQYRQTEPQKAVLVIRVVSKISLAMCFTVSMLLALTSSYVAEHALSHPELANGLIIGAALLFFSVAASIHEAALLGYQRFSVVSKVGVLRGGATLLLAVPMAMLWGAEGFLGALSIVAAVAYLWLRRLTNTEMANVQMGDSREHMSRRELVALASFTLPGFLTIGIASTGAWLGRADLAHAAGGLVEVGLFEAANQWRALVLFLPAILARVSLTILSDARSTSASEFDDASAFALLGVSAVTAPVSIVAIGSSWLLGMMLGGRFLGVEQVLPPIMAWVYFVALNQAMRTRLDSAGLAWSGFWLHLLWLFVLALLLYRLFRPEGAAGLAWSFLTAEIVMFAAQYLYIQARLPLRRGWTLAATLALSAVLIGLMLTANCMLQRGWATSLAVALSLVAFWLPVALLKSLNSGH
jgi:O-antigen/teichoic acid export membrane protein